MTRSATWRRRPCSALVDDGRRRARAPVQGRVEPGERCGCELTIADRHEADSWDRLDPVVSQELPRGRGRRAATWCEWLKPTAGDPFLGSRVRLAPARPRRSRTRNLVARACRHRRRDMRRRGRVGRRMVRRIVSDGPKGACGCGRLRAGSAGGSQAATMCRTLGRRTGAGSPSWSRPRFPPLRTLLDHRHLQPRLQAVGRGSSARGRSNQLQRTAPDAVSR
jgi:hypothetical protein